MSVPMYVFPMIIDDFRNSIASAKKMDVMLV